MGETSELDMTIETGKKQPVEFDGGSFTIPFLSTSVDGFEVVTDHSIRRTSGLTPDLLDDKQKDTLRGAIKGEVKFQGSSKIDEAESDSEKEEARQKYIRGMAGKIGARNIHREGNTIHVDVKLVSFQVFNKFANPEDSPEVLDLSSDAAAAMILKSSDDRIIIQHRAVSKQRLDSDKLTQGNALYNDIPGASVAGMLDASIISQRRKHGTRDPIDIDTIKHSSQGRNPGTPDPIDTDTIKHSILKETGEELGLDADDISRLRIVGTATDNIKVHDEFLFLGESNLTAGQIKEKSRISKKNKNLGDADFEEKFIDIDGSPESIATLLTEVMSPIPPTHAAVLVAAGYSIVLQSSGLEAAQNWKSELETKVQDNYKKIDERVTSFYMEHPKALTQIPDRLWGKKKEEIPPRNTYGYTPAYTPSEQGLPDFEDEMVRTGLTPETRRSVDEAYLFDVDGVLSDLQEKKVLETELFDELIKRLESGIPVGLNTGRSTEWMIKRVIEPLVERVGDKSLLDNFVAIGEMGGSWVTFDSGGEMKHGRVQSLTIPEDFKERIQELINSEYSDSMEFDSTKETMISVEMRDGYDVDKFHQRQKQLEVELVQLIEELDIKNLGIDLTTIATDIKSPYLGKALGADRFLEFLRDKGVKPDRFISFGDSRSDFEMSDELERRGKEVTMVYVGDKARIGEIDRKYPIQYEPGSSAGTLRYLIQHR